MSATETVAEETAAGITVAGLRIGLTARPGVDVVDDVDLVLAPGEVVGLVGESGSGKTTVGTAMLGYCRDGAEVEHGSVVLGGRDILTLGMNEVRNIRGTEIAYMPQDPASALNPAIRIGRQIVELLELRGIGTAAERDERARAALVEVGLPDDDDFLRRYPHQLSGGQVQRVALAMAFLPRPKVLVLDEPTTGLDVTTQGMVLESMNQLCRTYQVAALYVTHDLAVVANIADRVAVMYAGRIIELGTGDAVFRDPQHPYTRALLDAIPHLSQPRALGGIPGNTPAPGSRPTGCRFRDRCGYAQDRCAQEQPLRIAGRAPGTDQGADHGSAHAVRCVRAEELPPWDINVGRVPDADPDRPREVVLAVDGLDVFYGRKQVVFDVTFDIGKAECVALVGESGSGKTTISRCVGGLHKDWQGGIEFDGHQVGKGSRKRSSEDRKRIQYVFQNPYQSLNPRMTIEQIIRRPLELFGIARGRAARERVAELLDAVALRPSTMALKTNSLSGGERQRVAIARALAAEPEILVCDEITSALDVSVQGSIVALLEELRQRTGIGMLFVTHNLALVRSIASRVQILNGGRIVESGPVAQVMDHPQQDYTRTLLDNSPRIDLID